MDDSDRQIRDNLLFPPVPRVFRDRSSPFETLNDEQFRRRYRFTRPTFFEIVRLMENDISPATQRSFSLNAAQRLAIGLHVLSSNSFQLKVGDAMGVHQSTVFRIFHQVVEWFSSNSSRFIYWPDKEELLQTQRRIFQKHHLPAIVGAIDGTHCRIIAPHKDEEQYVNRKQFHSINLSAIVDDTYRFLWISPRFGGRAHDSRVFTESSLYLQFVNGNKKGVIVGDSAYRAEPFLIKVISRANLSPSEIRYNEAVCKFRVCVENAFGQLKRQWHCLHAELRYEPLTASKVITTCVCLRNIAIMHKDPMFTDMDSVDPNLDDDNDEDDDEATGNTMDDGPGNSKMLSIIHRYFQ